MEQLDDEDTTIRIIVRPKDDIFWVSMFLAVVGFFAAFTAIYLFFKII